MAARSNDLGNALDELNAQSLVMVRPEGETVVSETQACTNCGVPAMWSRNLGVIDVRQWRLRREETKRRSERPVAVGIASQRDAVVGADAHHREYWRPSLVKPVGKEVAHRLSLPPEQSRRASRSSTVAK